MPKIATLGKDRQHVLDPIDIKGNGPASIKPWILVGLAVAAYFVMKSKSL